jgi:hypothetical protein
MEVAIVQPTHKRAAPQLQQGVAAPVIKNRIHFLGMLFSLLLWGALTCLVLAPGLITRILQVIGWEQPSSETPQAIAIVAVLGYLFNSFASPTLKYLWHLNPVEDVVAYIRGREATPPELGFTCECYHMETRTRFITEHYTEYEEQYDPSTQSCRTVAVSKSRQKQETDQERVVTFKGDERFGYSQWDDISGELTADIYRYQAMRVDFSFKVDFGDREIEDRYNVKKKQFISNNERRDKCFDFHEYCRIADFHPRMLAIVDAKKKSPLLHWVSYIFIALVGLSWPYRIWFDRETASGAFTFRKRIFACRKMTKYRQCLTMRRSEPGLALLQSCSHRGASLSFIRHTPSTNNIEIGNISAVNDLDQVAHRATRPY